MWKVWLVCLVMVGNSGCKWQKMMEVMPEGGMTAAVEQIRIEDEGTIKGGSQQIEIAATYEGGMPTEIDGVYPVVADRLPLSKFVEVAFRLWDQRVVIESAELLEQLAAVGFSVDMQEAKFLDVLAAVRVELSVYGAELVRVKGDTWRIGLIPEGGSPAFETPWGLGASRVYVKGFVPDELRELWERAGIGVLTVGGGVRVLWGEADSLQSAVAVLQERPDTVAWRWVDALPREVLSLAERWAVEYVELEEKVLLVGASQRDIRGFMEVIEGGLSETRRSVAIYLIRLSSHLTRQLSAGGGGRYAALDRGGIVFGYGVDAGLEILEQISVSIGMDKGAVMRRVELACLVGQECVYVDGVQFEGGSVRQDQVSEQGTIVNEYQVETVFRTVGFNFAAYG